jgi:hypothetical protein
MKLQLCLCVVLLSVYAFAQSGNTYTIKPGESIINVISISEVFKYPSFVVGTVIFKDGRNVRSRLNYNSLIGQIQFIDLKGDTLSLAEEETVRYIIIDRDSFCYDKGYIELITDESSVRLGKKVFFKEFEQKPGSYGLSSGTTAAVSLSSILEKRAFELNTDQELVLIKSVEYFIGNKNEFLLANKKNVVKLFPKHKKPIETYFDANVISFNEEKDVLKLAEFLETL